MEWPRKRPGTVLKKITSSVRCSGNGRALTLGLAKPWQALERRSFSIGKVQGQGRCRSGGHGREIGTCRGITISSGGKTFSFTGWKVGWACAKPELIAAIRSVKQFLTFVNAAPFQPAIAVGLRLGDDYFAEFAAELQGKRDRLNAGLEAAGFTVYSPQGTYFSTVDIRPLGYDDGRAFCLALPELAGVVAIPSQVFYTNKHEGKPLVRFAFCKQDAMLDEAVTRLATLNQ